MENNTYIKILQEKKHQSKAIHLFHGTQSRKRMHKCISRREKDIKSQIQVSFCSNIPIPIFTVPSVLFLLKTNLNILKEKDWKQLKQTNGLCRVRLHRLTNYMDYLIKAVPSSRHILALRSPKRFPTPILFQFPQKEKCICRLLSLVLLTNVNPALTLQLKGMRYEARGFAAIKECVW